MPGKVGPCHQGPEVTATAETGQLGRGDGAPPLLSCVTSGKCLSLSGPSVRSAWAHPEEGQAQSEAGRLVVAFAVEIMGWRPEVGCSSIPADTSTFQAGRGLQLPHFTESQVEAQARVQLAQSQPVSDSAGSWSALGWSYSVSFDEHLPCPRRQRGFASPWGWTPTTDSSIQ